MEISKREHNKGRLLIVATALLWGLAGVCVKSIPWNPLSITAARTGIGIIMLGMFNKTFKLSLNRKTVLGSVLMSLTGILYMVSIKLTTAATAIVLQYTAPLFVFLYSIFFKKVKPKLIETAIVLIVFCGCALSFADDLNITAVWGNILGLLSGITFAGQIIVFGDSKADSGQGMYFSNIISFLFSLPSLFFDKALAFSPRIIFWVLVLSIFQYGLANICYSKGCKLTESIETSLLLTIEPIFNPIPVLFVTGEKMGTLALIGFFIVIIGVTAYAVLPKLQYKT